MQTGTKTNPNPCPPVQPQPTARLPNPITRCATPTAHGAGGHRASHPAAQGRGHQAALVLTSLPTTAVVGSASASLSLAELISALISSAEAK